MSQCRLVCMQRGEGAPTRIAAHCNNHARRATTKQATPGAQERPQGGQQPSIAGHGSTREQPTGYPAPPQCETPQVRYRRPSLTHPLTISLLRLSTPTPHHRLQFLSTTPKPTNSHLLLLPETCSPARVRTRRHSHTPAKPGQKRADDALQQASRSCHALLWPQHSTPRHPPVCPRTPQTRPAPRPHPRTTPWLPQSSRR
jgi:hypothetical protein